MAIEISNTALLELPPPYERKESIGEGTFAKVFKALDTRNQQIVAAKVLLPRRNQQEFIARFNQEWDIIQKLNDEPTIIKVFDKGTCTWGNTETIFFSMEFIEGGSLGKKLENRFDREQAMEVVNNISTALSKAHNSFDENNQGIIHRDVKPDNILLKSNGKITEAILTDFGIAKIILNDPNNQLSHTIYPQGSIPYMAPEQWDDFNNIDKTIDIYALAVTFFQMLVGNTKFFKDIRIKENCFKPLPFLSKVVAEYPSYQFFDEVLIKATAVKKEERYQSAAEFYDALNEANKKAQRYEQNQELASKIIDIVQELKDNAMCQEPEEYETVLALLDMTIRYLPDNENCLVLKSELYMQGYNDFSDEIKKECIAFLRNTAPKLTQDIELRLRLRNFIAEKNKGLTNVK